MIAEELVTTARNEFERVLQYVMEANNIQISDMEKGIFRTEKVVVQKYDR